MKYEIKTEWGAGYFETFYCQSESNGFNVRLAIYAEDGTLAVASEWHHPQGVYIVLEFQGEVYELRGGNDVPCKRLKEFTK